MPARYPEFLDAKCPRCQTQMDQEEAAGLPELMIDVCPNCGGVFLDNGELAKIRVHDAGVYTYFHPKEKKPR